MDKPFSYFNGLVPLFVQFVDIHCFEFVEEKNKNSSIPSTYIMNINIQVYHHSLFHCSAGADGGYAAKVAAT